MTYEHAREVVSRKRRSGNLSDADKIELIDALRLVKKNTDKRLARKLAALNTSKSKRKEEREQLSSDVRELKAKLRAATKLAASHKAAVQCGQRVEAADYMLKVAGMDPYVENLAKLILQEKLPARCVSSQAIAVMALNARHKTTSSYRYEYGGRYAALHSLLTAAALSSRTKSVFDVLHGASSGLSHEADKSSGRNLLFIAMHRT